MIIFAALLGYLGYTILYVGVTRISGGTTDFQTALGLGGSAASAPSSGGSGGTTASAGAPSPTTKPGNYEQIA